MLSSLVSKPSVLLYFFFTTLSPHSLIESFTTFIYHTYTTRIQYSLATLLDRSFTALFYHSSFIYNIAVCIIFVLDLLLAVFAFGLGAHGQDGQGKWEFYAFEGFSGMFSYGRLDPLLAPGEVSLHVHQIQGANAMSATYDYDTIRSESTCSTIAVHEDLSNYWAPALYHYDGLGNYSLMLSNFHVYYQFFTKSYDPSNSSGSLQHYPFPEGLTMLAGDLYQQTINESDPTSTASVFQCQRNPPEDSPYSHDMRDFQRSGIKCDNSLRATTRFPSCSDGVANNSDFVSVAKYNMTGIRMLANTSGAEKTHVVYPGAHSVCPETHPRALMQLTYEWYWSVQDFPFDSSREDNWVFSFGDTSGFGFHGDWTNGQVTSQPSSL